MDKKTCVKRARAILAQESDIRAIASGFKKLWHTGEVKTNNLVKKALRDTHEHEGIAVEILQAIGKEAGKKGGKDFIRFSALAGLLWNEYGREGRIVAAHILCILNETHPDETITLCRTLVALCVSWEECDTMTYGIEPIVRKNPKDYLGRLEGWMGDPNKWVKRVALNVIARLPMKQPKYTKAALSLIVPCLSYEDKDVRRTCSFAIRFSARGDIKETVNFMKSNMGGDNPTKIWIFSDAIRSMTKAFLPEFAGLLPAYRKWRTRVSDPPSIKSLDAAISILEKTT